MSFITALGTAVPENSFSQTKIAEFMIEALQLDATESRKLRALYRMTRINKRHSVVNDYGRSVEDFEFFPKSSDLEPFPTVSKRMELYKATALPLALKAIEQLKANAKPDVLLGITHVITVSCTGMYAPGLDIELVKTLGLDTSVNRTAINFMGCYGAFNGLKMADTICKAMPDSKVLVVSVELCTIHFQKRTEEDFLLSNALFADGAAAVLVEGNLNENPNRCLSLKSFFCDLYFEGEQDMAWEVADFGFEMTLTSYIPKLVKNGIKSLTDRLLANAKISSDNVSLYAMHPGGKAILEAIETALGISREDNRYSYRVLSEYGNMSSCTVLFVLGEVLKEMNVTDIGRNILSCAFGPGLTLESMILEVV
jgi:alpha-pyrone synthase